MRPRSSEEVRRMWKSLAESVVEGLVMMDPIGYAYHQAYKPQNQIEVNSKQDHAQAVHKAGEALG